MGDGFCHPRAEVHHGLSYGLSAYGGQMLYKRWAVNGTWFLQGHHSEQTNRTSPTQWMFVIKICGVLCEQFVFPSSSELRLFQCKKHRYLKQKNAIICLCQLWLCHINVPLLQYILIPLIFWKDIPFIHTLQLRDSTQDTVTTSYFTFLGSRRGTYQFCSWHLSMWATLVHPEKIEVFCKIPFKWWRIEPFLSFWGVAKKSGLLIFVVLQGGSWSMVHSWSIRGEMVGNSEKLRLCQQFPSGIRRTNWRVWLTSSWISWTLPSPRSARGSQGGILGDGGGSMTWQVIRYLIRKTMITPGFWSDSKCGSQNKKIRNDIRDKAFEHLKKVTFCDYAYVLTCFSFNCFF